MLQDPSTLPANPCDGTTGWAEEDLKIQARKAGDFEPDMLHRCYDCEVYQAGQFDEHKDCEHCRTHPEPEADEEVARLIHWMRDALDEIEKADNRRQSDRRPLNDAAFRVATAAAINDLNDDCERLLTVIDEPDPERLAHELSVHHVAQQGEDLLRSIQDTAEADQ